MGLRAHKLQEIEPTSDEEEFVIPPCPVCGAEDSLKPDVVLFGDSVPRKVVDTVNTMVEQVDSCIVIGTSLSTFSSFRLVKVRKEAALSAAKNCADDPADDMEQDFHDKGKPIAIVSVGPTRADSLPSLHLRVEALVGATLRRVVEKRAGCAKQRGPQPLAPGSQ